MTISFGFGCYLICSAQVHSTAVQRCREEPPEGEIIDVRVVIQAVETKTDHAPFSGR